MENLLTTCDTLVDALDQLKARGYTQDFSVLPGDNCLICSSTSATLSPEEFQIDEILRFEGQTDPDDEMILFAISSDKFGIKGFVVNAYGIYAEDTGNALVEKLTRKIENKTHPIKRHPALVAFSRDHHFGLLLVWKIRRGLESGVSGERISSYLLYFFEQDLLPHFRKEEVDLFSQLPEGDFVRAKALGDHRKIYELVERITRDSSNKDLLAAFADTLDRHIRFEERTLFNHLQRVLTGAQLSALERIGSEKQLDVDNNWNDHFWTLK
ncbi:MAG TPA: hemerythrin domain-containing protein [Puia sp.]|nr:hemerythrin domain-containing protein [Puia sp.]